MIIKILGGGCKKCHLLEEHAKEAVKSLGLEAEFIKVTDLNDIVEHGVMQTPALIVDGKIVSTGRVLTAKKIEALLSE